jgi:DNA polymerase-3 subunit beta
MEKKFSLETKNLKNIILFNPEISLEDVGGADGSITIKISNGELTFRILSFRYLLIGTEHLDLNDDLEMVLPLKKLQDIIRNFPDDTKIDFTITKAGTVNISVNEIKFKLKMILNEGNTQILDEKNKTKYIVLKDKFLEGLRKVKIAMGDDEVRYYLNGIHIEVLQDKNKKDETVKDTFFVATSGHLLATYGNKVEGSEILEKAIIPKKVIPDVIKVLEKTEKDEIEISFEHNKMGIKTDNLEIALKLIEADFPDYNKVIPQNNDKLLIIDVERFKNILTKVSLISATDKNKDVKLKANNGILELEVTSADGNTATGEINLETGSDEVETKLNIKYLLDILGQITDKILIKFVDGNMPILMEQDTNKSLIFVVMPIRS